MLKISELSDTWNDEFFADFHEVRRIALRNHAESLPETIDDLRAYFDPARAFGREHRFRAWVVKDDGRPVARGASFLPRVWKDPPFLPFGFFEFVDHVEAARKVLDQAIAFGRSLGIRELKAPIDGSFFGSYRLVTDSTVPTIYGEPRRPEHYLRIYGEIGLEAYKRWTTYLVPNKEFLEQSDAVIKRFYPQGFPPGLQMRTISGATWNEDVDIVHKLFVASYSQMSEYMPVSLEAFRELYGSFRHIVDPKYSRLLFSDGVPVAFFVGYDDPFAAIAPVKRWAEKLPKWMGPLLSLVGLARIKTIRGPALAPYMGKDPAAETRGAMAILMGEFAKNIPAEAEGYYSVYVAEGGPALKSFPPTIRPLTRYAMYRKTL